MKAICLSLLLIPHFCLSWVSPESFDSTYLEIEESIFSATIKGRYRDARGLLSNDVVDHIINDNDNLVHDDFNIPSFFEDSVRFWFSIYTQYTSEQVVIHDSENLGLVYNVLDFSELHNHKEVHYFAKAKLQTQLSQEYTKRLKKILKRMARKKQNKLNAEEDDIATTIIKAGLTIPKSSRKRRKFFTKLVDNLRTQTGQRNLIYQGVNRALPYFDFLEDKIKLFGLPKELIAISFLESSFNIKAHSKVSAVGIWQFMPFIGNLFMPRSSKNVDYRRNPIISSLAAFHLLKENKLILRRWDLAVPAYNSGPKHLKKAIKKFSKHKDKKNIGLEYILKNYEHPHIGFASKNFYSEFLALTRVLAYKSKIYPLKGLKNNQNFKNVDIYVSKCRIKPIKIFKALKENSPQITDLNYHFLNPHKVYSRGHLIVSDLSLTSRKYYKLSDKQIKSVFPKKYKKFIKSKSCQ